MLFEDEFSLSNTATAHYSWSKNGEVESAGGLKLRPRDMLKFGITYLNDGKWNDESIVPAAWV